MKPGHAVAVSTLDEFATAARKLHAAGFRPRLFLDELEQLVWRPGVFDDALFDAWLELGREGAIGFAATAHVAPAELFAQGGYQTRRLIAAELEKLGLPPCVMDTDARERAHMAKLVKALIYGIDPFNGTEQH